MIPLTADQVMRATGSTRTNAEKHLPFIQGTCKAYGITTPRTISGFLSQIGVECGALTNFEESLNYSVEGLQRFVRWKRISAEDAQKYGRAPGRRADQQMIANLIYGGEWGKKNLGNLKFGDGWAHRGMGAKQLTGLDNHRRCGEAIGEDFVTSPERLLMPVNSWLSAGWFWSEKKLSRIAETENIMLLTERVNGGHTALDQRTILFHQGLTAFA